MITQVGVATASDELIQHIVEATKDTIEMGDIGDYPSRSGQTGRYMTVVGTPGNEEQAWVELPPTGLVWRTQEVNVQMEDKIGYLSIGGITLTLPSSPEDGTLVAIADRDGSFSSDPVTVVPSGGDDILGDSELILDMAHTYIQIIYSNGTWNITNVNHPFNMSEITEENFPAGNTNYLLGRIPPSRASIMVIYKGLVLTTDQYALDGNQLTFSTPRMATVTVRYIGLPMVPKVIDTPVGMCAYFPRLPAPDGWLFMDGSTITSVNHPELVYYLTKDRQATSAVLPLLQSGDVLQAWNESEVVGTQAIPEDLSDNTWGRWLATTHEATTRNIWGPNDVNATSVLFEDKYVGYQFDVPVTVTSMSMTVVETLDANLPVTVSMEYSIDGGTWVQASNTIGGGSNINNTTTIINSTVGAIYAKYWRISGSLGAERSDGSGLYWGITDITITGSTENRLVGSHRDAGQNSTSVSIDGVAMNATEVDTIASGSGQFVLEAAGADILATDAINEGSRPASTAMALCIKARSIQGMPSTTSSSTLEVIQAELARLSAIVG